MEASANVETDLESVSTDKGNDKISETVCLDNDVEKSKIDVSESVECINNGDISDTDTCVGKNNQMEPVSTSKDIVNLNSAIASDKSDEIVDIPLELKDDINTDSHKDSENVYGVDDENLLEEIHSGEFAAVSSPSKENLNTSMQSVELLEEEQDIEEEEEVEEEEEEEEEKGQINDDDPTIILDDDDDDEDERNQRATDDESLTDEESDNEDEESQDITDRDDIDEFDDHKDDDLSTLSSEGDVEVISKVPEKKSLPLRHRNAKTIYKSLVKRSIRALTSTKPKRAMRLKPSNDIEKVSEHPNGNNENIATEKTKEAEKMVQMFSNECTEVIGDDDVCLIEDSPVKMNGKHALEDVAAVKDNVPIEQTREENKVASDKEQVEEIEEMEVSQPNEQHQSVNGDASMKESNAVKDECVVAVIEGKANTTDSKPEETVPSVVNVDEEAIENVNKPKPNYKRSLADSPEDVQPTKRLKAELEESFVDHNKRLQAFIDEKPNNSAQDINNHIEILQADVQRLEAMAKSKEQEWNRILYYKRVKEEIIYRLIRRRNVLEVSSTKIGEVEDYTILEQQPSISQKITKENRSSGMGLNQHSYLRNAPTTETAKLINSRADMSTRDLDGEKVTTAKMQSILFPRSILPKPELTNRSSPIINHLTSSTPTNLQHIQQPKAQNFMEHPHQIFQQSEHLNGHHQVGRQGATITAKSIIDGFYQKNPERPPRRGRRLKGCNNDGSTTSPRLNDGLLNRQSLDGRTSELGLLLAKDRNSRPSSADSSPGHSNLANINNNISNVSFNDVLMQYAKLNERPSEMLTSSSISRQQSGYPEVTLHPVSSQQNTPLHQSDSLQSNSLLHGILTKNTTRPSSAYNSFSPTLARLLTDPQRMTTLPNNYRLLASTSTPHKPSGINLTKPRNEITITPVMANPLMHQTILQQQLQRHQESAARMKFPVMDDEADDSADRLVIDEGDIHNEQNASTGGREFPENEFPKCQGCKKHEAQFVCAGCENQWYCSRSCQVSAWDEHCELCSG